MKLDESIELKNKNQNTTQMNKTKLSVTEMRNCIHEMMGDEGMSSCLYEVLTQEGFLPEGLSEGEEHGNLCEVMMEDDMVTEELFKACGMNQSECGNNVREWVENHAMAEYDNSTAQQQQPKPESFRVTKEAIMNELSPEAKFAAHNAAMMKNKTHDVAGQEMERRKTMGQADTFAKHIDPQINSQFQAILKSMGGYVGNIEKSVSHNEKKPYVVMTMHSPDNSNSIKIVVTKTGNKLIHGEVSNELKPIFLRLIKNIQMKELPDNSMVAAGMDEMSPATMSNSGGLPSDNTEMMDEGDTDRATAFETYQRLMEAGVDPTALLEYIIGHFMNGTDALEAMSAAQAEFLGDDNNTEEEPGIEPEMEMPNDGTEETMPIAENELPKFVPVKGKNVDSENKTNAKDGDSEEIEDANESQKTTDEKTEERINVKFSPDMESDFQKEVNDKHLGAWNMLNLDFQNDVPDSYKNRVELEVTTGHSRPRDEKALGKEANVDHESTERVGKKMVAASVKNQGERDSLYKANPIVTTQDPYEQTSITGAVAAKNKKHGGDLVKEDINSMKRLFGYEQSRLDENVKTAVDENDVIFKSVSKKTFI